MIFVDTRSTDVFYNFGAELYFAREKRLEEDVFMLWRTTPTLMIGRFQNTLEEIDAAYARERGITVVRRMSGGGTIYTDPGGWQFTWITPAGGLGLEFSRFMDPVVEALCSLGVPAEATGRNDITVGGKKVSGNAQFRLGAATVHHGSLLFDTDLDELTRSATPKPYKITSKAIASVRDRVTNIRAELPPEKRDMTAEDFGAYLRGRLASRAYDITPEDDERIRAIGDAEFRDERKLYAKTPRFETEKEIHTPGGTFTLGFSVKNGRILDAAVSGDFFGTPDAAETLSHALVGTEFTPSAVRKALESCRESLFRADPAELVRGVFE